MQQTPHKVALLRYVLFTRLEWIEISPYFGSGAAHSWWSVCGETSRIGGDTLSHYDGITQTAKRLPLWFVFKEWSGSEGAAQVLFHSAQWVKAIAKKRARRAEYLKTQQRQTLVTVKLMDYTFSPWPVESTCMITGPITEILAVGTKRERLAVFHLTFHFGFNLFTEFCSWSIEIVCS